MLSSNNLTGDSPQVSGHVYARGGCSCNWIQKQCTRCLTLPSLQSMIETISYQMQQNAPADVIGGAVAFLKVMATKTFELCARESAQIFGGARYQP